MKTVFKITISLVIWCFVFIGCNKDEIAQTSNIEGAYSGISYQHERWSNPISGYNERDTIFNDTFYIKLIGNDSISFMNKGGEWPFVLDTNNIYEKWFGSHSRRIFTIKSNDSLIVNYWSYGGYSGSFNPNNSSL